jgi:Tol biopolymer transport system component
LFRSLGNVSVTDAQASRLLLLQETIRGSVLARAPGASAEKDLAWLDYSILADMSRDGTLALFSEDGEGGGGHGMIYLRRTDGSPATKIGPGHALALSPDGRWVAAKSDLTGEVSVLPTGAGSARKVSLHGLIPTWVWFTLDASALLIYGSEQNHSLRFFLVPVEGGTPRPLTPEGISGQMSLSPDGQWLAVSRADGRLDAYPLAGGQPRVLPRVEPGELPIQWSSDGRALFVGRFLRLPVRVYRLDLETGARSLWRSLSPSDPAGIYGGVNDLFVAPDGSSYCYSAFRWLSELHVVEGLL